MLETDPSKRPDIYQVSHLVFSLAEHPCPIKNRKVNIYDFFLLIYKRFPNKSINFQIYI